MKTFKSNLNIIDLNAGKNLGFKPDGSYSYVPFDKYHSGYEHERQC